MLILLRNFETTDEIQKILTGRRDSELTDLGKQSVDRILEDLSAYRFDHVYSSSQSSAVETAKLLGFEYECREELCERSGGILEGKLLSEIKRILPPNRYKLWDRDFWEPTPQGESLEDVRDRVMLFLNRQVRSKLEQNQNILIISHDAILRVIIGTILGLEETEMIRLTIEQGVPYVGYDWRSLF